MITGHLAVIVAALFAGAAIYVNVAEQLARLDLDDRSLLIQWKPAYKRGFAMQASLAIVGFLLGALAWWRTNNWAWLLGAFVIVANWPYTLLVMMPTKTGLWPSTWRTQDRRVVHSLTSGSVCTPFAPCWALPQRSFFCEHQ
jgi:hypothetical protein